MPKKHTYEFVRRCFENQGYTLLEKEYINSHTSMQYICKKHPSKIRTIKYTHLQQGKGCYDCGINKIKESKILSYHDVKSKFEYHGYTLLEEKYINNRTPMKFRCSLHPNEDLYISYDSLNQGHGCRMCARELSSKKQRLSFDFVKQAFDNKGFDLLDDTYINAHTPMRYLCRTHPNIIHTTTYLHLTQRVGCPLCAGSKAEHKVREYLNRSGIDYIYQYRTDECKNIKHLSFDFLLPARKIAIEVNGKQHYEPIDYFGGIKTFKKQQINDDIKRNYCKENNILLIEIPYWNFDTIETVLTREVGVKSMSA